MAKVTIKKSDLKFRAFRGSGPGGQHRNTTESCIEVTHVPTGLKAKSCMKSQHQSKAKALRLLLTRLVEHFKTPTERFRVPSIRVRTYHGPNNVVTDHGSGFKQLYTEVVDKADLSEMIRHRAEWGVINEI